MIFATTCRIPNTNYKFGQYKWILWKGNPKTTSDSSSSGKSRPLRSSEELEKAIAMERELNKKSQTLDEPEVELAQKKKSKNTKRKNKRKKKKKKKSKKKSKSK